MNGIKICFLNSKEKVLMDLAEIFIFIFNYSTFCIVHILLMPGNIQIDLAWGDLLLAICFMLDDNKADFVTYPYHNLFVDKHASKPIDCIVIHLFAPFIIFLYIIYHIL